MSRRIATLVLALLLGACAAPAPRPMGDDSIRLEAWTEAEGLFRQDPRWRGADDAHTADLGRGRILWLFADSFVDPAGKGRRAAAMPRNTVAVQEGADPSRATMTFAWKEEGGRPSSFFPEEGSTWYWPADGHRLGETLLVFLMLVRSSPMGLGFEVFGWTAVIVENPDDPPGDWRCRKIPVPPTRERIIAASGGLLVDGDHLLAYSVQEGSDHAVFLMRWPIERAAKGELRDPEWWCGEERGWQRLEGEGPGPEALFRDSQTEFTVERDPRGEGFLQIQSIGFGGTDIGCRAAPRPTGPFGPLVTLHRPPESDRPGLLVYAAKSHPELAGAPLVLTYVANDLDFGRLLDDETLYYPRILRGRLGAAPR